MLDASSIAAATASSTSSRALPSPGSGSAGSLVEGRVERPELLAFGRERGATVACDGYGGGALSAARRGGRGASEVFNAESPIPSSADGPIASTADGPIASTADASNCSLSESLQCSLGAASSTSSCSTGGTATMSSTRWSTEADRSTPARHAPRVPPRTALAWTSRNPDAPSPCCPVAVAPASLAVARACDGGFHPRLAGLHGNAEQGGPSRLVSSAATTAASHCPSTALAGKRQRSP